MAYSQAQLTALQNALARGITRVTYENRTIEYGSVDNLRKAILIVQADLNRQQGVSAPRQVRVYTSKGFDMVPFGLSSFPFVPSLQLQGARLSGYATLTVATIANASSASQATLIPVQGAPVGAPVLLEANPILPAGVQAFGKVNAPNLVTVEISNLSGAPVTLGTGVYTAIVLVN